MKAVVVAGGDADPADVRELADAALLVAADGGAAWLQTAGRRPHLLVGDLDSIDVDLAERLAGEGTTVERHAIDKDASDLELALETAVRGGADRIVILGALAGARLDHELANLLCVADPRWLADVADLRVVRRGVLVRAVHGGRNLELEAPPGAPVSLLPLGGDANGVTTVNLRYALHDEPLRFGRSRGLSNVVAAANASVSLERGVLLVIEYREGVET
ncbi:MAG TPA: thiamine diphosphokinase [Candidatus Limnocylindrales bacterium]|nr:thiamine diphosphokinase [Candidatus Limnocylindrales bacterium]